MREIANKWTKFEVLQSHDGVSKHLPAMRKFDASALKQMLSDHRFVVVKPLVGSGGLGVAKIEMRGADHYDLHYQRTLRRGLPWTSLLQQVNRIRRGRAYMIQQGIRLAQVNGRNVDYRVKLIKQNKTWRITAIVARLAASRLFVTNLCRGGRMMKGMQALRRTFPAYARGKRATMVGVARTCTALLEKRYPGIRALGYDFGVDQKGDVWLFEVNTRPH